MEVRDAARALVANRPRYTVKCQLCGGEIEGTRTRRFCSNACRVKASRRRRRELAETSTEPPSGPPRQAPPNARTVLGDSDQPRPITVKVKGVRYRLMPDHIPSEVDAPALNEAVKADIEACIRDFLRRREERAGA